MKKVLHYAITKGGAACDTVTDFTVMKGGSTFYAATCSNGINAAMSPILSAVFKLMGLSRVPAAALATSSAAAKPKGNWGAAAEHILWS